MPFRAAKVAMEGILLIDKPAGMTSHDVVARVRGSLGGRSEIPPIPDRRRSRREPRTGHRSSIAPPKTGHAGTLDPFATGLLVVLLGGATKLQRRIMELPKRYETIARLGASSTTGDPEGEITLTGRLPAERPSLPTGEIRQRPPIYSAVKIGGERAYKRARRGESFQMPERIVSVTRFEQLWREPPDPADGTARAAYAIDCSSGTYVRSLIADLGDAYCEQLRRTAIGPFQVGEAVALPPRGLRWESPPLLSVAEALTAVERYVA